MAYCTGVGKVMLAHQPEAALADLIDQQSFHAFTPRTLTSVAALREELRAIRLRGYGFDREEHEPGIICVAAPILSDKGRCLGALSVASTRRRSNPAGLELLVPLLRDSAGQIARAAQDWRFPETQQSHATRGRETK